MRNPLRPSRLRGETASRLTLRLLGAPEVHLAGSPLALSNQKARALLFYLAATGQPHTRDHLATLLWSDSPAAEARHSLRSTLYRLRQALRAGEVEGALIEDHDLLSLQIADDCDVIRFRNLLAEGGDRALADAVTLYRGPFLQGFTLPDAPLFEEWQRFEETRLSRAYVEALERLAARAEARQAWGEAIACLERLVQIDPLAEDAQRQLIRLYAHTGGPGQALRQYHDFETRLRRELGLMPAPETQALYHELLQAGRPEPSPGPPRPARKPPLLPFVGRDELLARLAVISQDPIAGHGVTILLQGEGGIGKSRLLDELVTQLSPTKLPPRWIVLRGVCSPFDDLLSYGPFAEALHDLPDLFADSREADPDSRGRFFWRVLQALRDLSREGPLLLAIDDLQWANSSTLNLFGFLAMRLGSLPVMLVGTVQRAEAIPALQRLITLGRRRGELHLFSLTPLLLDAVTALLRASGLTPASIETLAEWLHERSGGSPFILAEMLAQLRAEGILIPVNDVWSLDAARWLRWHTMFTLPETTHDLVAWRLAALSPEARRLLDVLAVAGQPLPFGLLHDLPDLRLEQLPSLVDDLMARGLLVETSEETLALPHHLLRATLLHRLSNIRRRALHRQLAQALEACPVLQADLPLRQIALHAVAGEDIDRARRYGLQALTDLQAASAETAGFLQHLHDLLAPIASPDERLRLAQALGRVHQSLGQLEAAARWLRQALEVAREVDDPTAQAAAYFELSELALVSNDYRAAAAAAESGLAKIKDDDQREAPSFHPSSFTLHPLNGRGHRLWGAALAMEGGDLPAAESHLQKAAAAQRLAGDQAGLCATLFELGNVAAQRGQVSRALEFCEDAARAAEAGGVYYFLALARNNFAYHSLLLGQPEAARQAITQGLKLAESHAMMGALLHLYSTQGELYLYLGEWAAAAESFQRGLALADELGNLERQAGYRAGAALAARGGGDLERAAALLEEALTLIAGQGYWHLRTRLQLWLAETLLKRGEIAEAGPHLDRALATARDHNRALLLVQGERLRARLLAESGDWPAANSLFAETAEQADALGFPLEVARTQAAWGEAALRHAPSPAHAEALLAEARAAFAAHGARAELEALGVDVATPSEEKVDKLRALIYKAAR